MFIRSYKGNKQWIHRAILGVKYYRNAKNVECLRSCHVAHARSSPAWPFLSDLRLAGQSIQCGALFWFGAVPFPSLDIFTMFFLFFFSPRRRSPTTASGQSRCRPPGAVRSKIKLHNNTSAPHNQMNWFYYHPHCKTEQEIDLLNRTTEDMQYNTLKY